MRSKNARTEKYLKKSEVLHLLAHWNYSYSLLVGGVLSPYSLLVGIILALWSLKLLLLLAHSSLEILLLLAH